MIYVVAQLRRCIPMLSTWLAYHLENVNMHLIKTNPCAVCMASLQRLGILQMTLLTYHNHGDYKKLCQARDMERYVYLRSSESCDQNPLNILAASLMLASSYLKIHCGDI